ncbi:MAG: hypothetical protein PVF33_03450 [Candidatus Latescibacterota bacterium]|jgi:hypothetical protein
MGKKSYPGADALVELHEYHLRRFLEQWRRAKKRDLTLPETKDKSYRSLDALLLHVMSCASRYIDWSARALGIPPPPLPELPGEEGIEAAADGVLEEILEAWRTPMSHLPYGAFDSAAQKAWWGTPYSVDAMLEHAVMHPIRHEWQLRKLSGTNEE